MKNQVGLLLKEEFIARKHKNVNYSLRAFSRDLKLSPSFLSGVLSGKKKISIDKALEVTRHLGWSWRETQLFLQSAQLSHAKSKLAKNFLKSELQRTRTRYGQFQKMNSRQFFAISDWYYVAIMELTEVAEFSDDPDWIARQLGITRKLAEDALLKLKNAKLIYKNDHDQWKKLNNTVQDTPSAEIRKFHRQQLENASVAIENQAFQKRHFSGVTMAIDSKKLPEAIELIREFRSRINSLLECGNKDSVYHLAVQLFQLDQSLNMNSKGYKNV
ncbi:MAG: DUF4423 domain-containing protein [Bdellovibrionota bacterium]